MSSNSNETTNKQVGIVYPIVKKLMFGRRKIYSSVDEITPENVLGVLDQAMTTHSINRGEIDYLYNYYKGKQPVLARIKNIREDIVNRIVVNRAFEIVSFKVGYQCAEPMQYTAVRAEEGLSAKIERLNTLMDYENKAKKDKDLVEWQMICGTAFRMVAPDTDLSEEEDEAPFEIITCDPMNTFVIYSNKAGEVPLASVNYWSKEIITGTNKDIQYNNVFRVSTPTQIITIEEGKIIDVAPNGLKAIPIVEYPANNARLGAFEIVLDLLDELSNLESNRMDGVEQTIQAFLKFINCDIDFEQFEQFKADGAIKVKSNDGQAADVDYVTTELSQSQVQTQVDNIYDTILTICGMPNRNGGSSTSDTGTAVYLRDGYGAAEARARDYETMFESSEREILKVVLKILRDNNVLDLKVSQVKITHPRRNYDNIQSKSQVLVTMLDNPKVAPKLAFEHCGMFTDPETAYEQSMKYYEEEQAKYEVQEVPESEDKAVEEE